MNTFLKRGFRPLISIIIVGLLVFTLMPPSAQAMPVFINEFHYDNVGGDVGEGVELAGVAGIDLQGWQLWFYNGSNGQSYKSLTLSGVLSNQQQGYGTLAFAIAGLQNGAPDGIALVDANHQLQQFISYEGAFMALSGVAAGVLSEDVGIVEGGGTAVGMSLQLRGPAIDQLQWQTGVNSFGVVNTGQQFTSLNTQEAVAVSTAPSWMLFAGGTFGLLLTRPRRVNR